MSINTYKVRWHREHKNCRPGAKGSVFVEATRADKAELMAYQRVYHETGISTLQIVIDAVAFVRNAALGGGK